MGRCQYVSNMGSLTIAHEIPRFLIIINPKSGKGQAPRIYERKVRPILEAAGCHISTNEEPADDERSDNSRVYITKGPGDAVKYVDKILMSQYDTILCISGDGGIHEVVNGMANRGDAKKILKKIAIAVIPGGTLSPFYSNARFWYDMLGIF
jgi:sphingosine kinase